MNWYFLLKFVHVLSVIVAVGANLTYGVWILRLRKQPEYAEFALRSVKFIDDYIANPAYILATLTGLIMIWTANFEFSTFWIAASLVLFSIVGILGYGAYTPTLRKQIEALVSEGAESPVYKRLAARQERLGQAIMLLILVVLYLMVAKPA